LLLSGLSGGEGTRRIIGVARMERSSAQWQKHREQEGHNANDRLLHVLLLHVLLLQVMAQLPLGWEYNVSARAQRAATWALN